MKIFTLPADVVYTPMEKFMDSVIDLIIPALLIVAVIIVTVVIVRVIKKKKK
ncbi:MAG: hypothetical protein LUH43_01995 [Clostridia bacterium]|nr:hypothetical protein [Clostridia bacterium]